MEFDQGDRFYKRLNPKLHFTRDGQTIRVASSAFKLKRYTSSVDAERLLAADPQSALQRERVLRDREHPGAGLGLFRFTDLPEGATVEHAPTESNDAHCNLILTSQAAARRLASRVRVIERPTQPVRVAPDEYVDPSEVEAEPL